MEQEQVAGAVTGGMHWLLRVEGLCLLVVTSLVYQTFGSGWGNFALFFLLPDFALLAYVAGPRWGALAYNATHATPGALAALAIGVLGGGGLWVSAGLIWLAHIGFDRALGYGLKYSAGFRETHLGRIGRERSVQG